MPVQLNICKASNQKTKRVNDQEYQGKIRSVETEAAKQARLNKANEYKKRKQSEETNCERQMRLQKEKESKKRKRSEKTDSERQVRLQKERESKKRKRSGETDSERQVRLEKDRLCEKQKQAKVMSQPRQDISQQEYLNLFDKTNNGSIEEQCWAKTNIIKFHKSMQYTVSHCTVCQEA